MSLSGGTGGAVEAANYWTRNCNEKLLLAFSGPIIFREMKVGFRRASDLLASYTSSALVNNSPKWVLVTVMNGVCGCPSYEPLFHSSC